MQLILTNLLHFDLTSSQILILSLCLEYLEVGNLFFSVPSLPGVVAFWMCKQENPKDNTRSKLNAKEEGVTCKVNVSWLSREDYIG